MSKIPKGNIKEEATLHLEVKSPFPEEENVTEMKKDFEQK